MSIKAVVLNVKDNVGVALMDLESGIGLDLEVNGQTVLVKLAEPITYQHKFSVARIDSGSTIVKYGEVMERLPRISNQGSMSTYTIWLAFEPRQRSR